MVARREDGARTARRRANGDVDGILNVIASDVEGTSREARA